jgi:arsenite methyltransferase
MSATGSPIDVDVLRSEIRRTYTDVSTDQQQEFIFPTGRAWAQQLGYPEPELSRVPDATVESFAGVANHGSSDARSRARSCWIWAAARGPIS